MKKELLYKDWDCYKYLKHSVYLMPCLSFKCLAQRKVLNLCCSTRAPLICQTMINTNYVLYFIVSTRNMYPPINVLLSGFAESNSVDLHFLNFVFNGFLIVINQWNSIIQILPKGHKHDGLMYIHTSRILNIHTRRRWLVNFSMDSAVALAFCPEINKKTY